MFYGVTPGGGFPSPCEPPCTRPVRTVVWEGATGRKPRGYPIPYWSVGGAIGTTTGSGGGGGGNSTGAGGGGGISTG